MKFREQEPEQTELNLTPLIDVVFLLLIFFMVSTTFNKESEIKVRLPQAASDKQPQESDDTIEVMVSATGQMHVAGKELVNNQLGTVRQALLKAANGRRDIPLVIRADKGTPYQSIVTVMDAGSQVGLLRISLPTLRVKE